VLVLRRRLACTGDLADSSGGSVFDATVESALRRFQARHGLRATGRLDGEARAALIVPAAERVRTLELNLERARWMPAVLPEPYLRVNIPEYRLSLVNGGVDSLAMRVVVGQVSSQTPVFSAAVSFLEFNPTWRLPKHILVEEILPAFRRDPEYFSKHQMRALWTAAREPVELVPAQVNWAAVEEDTFHVLVAQDAGPENPLGRIKFMCPNQYDVYLHDTPARGYFASQVRDLSHGCVRVENPLGLAERLLRGTPVASRDSIESIIAGAAWRRVVLAQRMPVHVQYWTSWVDSAGDVQFRTDIYGLDRRLDAALRAGRTSDFVINPEVLWGSKRPGGAHAAREP
jgi:murein L,D-transpeptidase YcbB/YkuD